MPILLGDSLTQNAGEQWKIVDAADIEVADTVRFSPDQREYVDLETVISLLALKTEIPTRVTVNHGTDASTARPTADTVVWVGSAEPTNAQDGDEWYQTTG